MKKNVFICCAMAFVASIFASCHKGDEIEPTSEITVLTPDGGNVEYAGEYFTVRWSDRNLPKGSYIYAAIREYTSDGNWYQTALHPQTIAATPPRDIVDLTADDGEEIYRIPLQQPSQVYGKHFKIILYAIHPDASGALSLADMSISGESQDYFIVNPPVFPAGCYSTAGYSATTGQPCDVVPN